MGFLDALFGRTRPPEADLDVLFRVPQAALTLAGEGFTFDGVGAVCFRNAEGTADDAVLAEATSMIATDAAAEVSSSRDGYGFSWLTVRRPGFDVAGVATDLHAVNASLVDHGFGPALLCSSFTFSNTSETGRVMLVYLFKRGTFYPFAPAGESKRDNALELRIRGLVENDIPIEADLSRWLAIWGAPGL